MKAKILLTDGELTSTLAVVRCLGRHENIEVHVTSEQKYSLSSHSKYCKGTHILPNPLDEIRYISVLVDLLKEEHFDVLIPVGYFSERTIIKNRPKLEKLVSVPVVDLSIFDVANRKDKTMDFANRIGLNVPRTYKISGLDDLKRIRDFPVVIKAVEGWGNTKYAKDSKDLLKKYKKVMNNKILADALPIVQEYIPGNNGYGFYALYNKGKIVTYYIHKRLHMYPRSGGPATMACTYYHREIYEQGKKILDSLRWHGVAMVEFKRSEKDGRFYIIEINPKYWGSIDLGISAGVEIPYYHAMLTTGSKTVIGKKYSKCLFRWPTRDFLYAISGKNKTIEILKWVALFFNFDVKDNILLSDFGPALFQVKDGIRRFRNRIQESSA